MPFVRKIENEAGILGIWKLSEPSNELYNQAQLTKSECAFLETIKNEKRKREFLAIRILLSEFDINAKIGYEKNGRPYLVNSQKNISISHSSDLAVILISEKNAGIDVEITGRNIAPIAKRFLSKNELTECENSTDKQLAQTIHWCAKEAIFKCTREANIQFNSQIKLHPFELKKSGNLFGELNIGGQNFKFDLSYFRIENNVIVYCVEL